MYSFEYPSSYYYCRNATLNQCRIINRVDLKETSSVTFNNCYLVYIYDGKSGKITFNNCVIRSSYFNYITNSIFINCFLYSTSTGNSLQSSNSANFCVGSRSESSYSNPFANLIDNSTDIMVDSLGAIFKTWRGTYSDQETFELTDEAKAKYLGNDGTQIGIYGGALPYDPTPSNPRITKFYLTPKPAEKKLEIQLEAE